jgi:hypothetical protein
MKTKEKTPTAISLFPILEVESIARMGILLCAFLVIAYCIWTLDRGFEITDEAFYLLLAMHPGALKFVISGQQWVAAWFWQVTGSIAMFRASGMVLLLAGSALLALGGFSACRRFGLVANRIQLKGVILAGSAVGAMLYASVINFSPSYNLLAAAGAYASGGMVLLASNRSNILQKYILYSLAGLAIGAEALCKPPSGVATLALLFFWVVIFERARFDKILGPVAIAFGAITFAVIVFLANTTIGEAAQAFALGMQVFRMVQDETIGSRLIRYASEYWEYLLITLRAFAIPITAMIVYATTRRAIFAQLGLAALAFTLIFGSIHAGWPTFSIHNATSDSFLFGGFDRYPQSAPIPRSGIQIIAVFAMLAMALIVSIPVWNKNRSTLALFVGLMLLPYTVGIGTGNALFPQVIGSLASWGLLIAVLVVERHSEGLGKVQISIIGICFIATIALQIITSSLRPYGMSHPLTEQDQVVVAGDLGEVKVDAETNKFLADIKAAAKECDITPGEPFIGLYNIPGVALALQAVPVLTPWITNRTQAEFIFERARPEELHSAVVALLVSGNGLFPGVPQQLAAFTLGYRYCGMATYPYMRQPWRIKIWQSQAR